MSATEDIPAKEKNVDEILHSVRNIMESDIGSLQEEGEISENAEVVLLTQMIKPPRGYKSVQEYDASRQNDNNLAGDNAIALSSDSQTGLPAISDEALKAQIQNVLEPIMLEWLDKKLAPVIRQTLDKEIKHLVQSMVKEAVGKQKK